MLRRRGLLAALLAGCAPSADPEAPAREPARTRAPVVRAPAPHAPAMFRAYPALARNLPRIELCTAPTPVDDAPGLARRIGLETLTIKRDDLTHGDYGGGKVRKLETLLARAEAERAERIVTFGSVGSHHALATAVHARAHGFAVELFLVPEPPSPFVRATLERTLATGARIRLTGTMKAAHARAAELERDGRTFVIPAGGTDPLANVGFVSAGFELVEQIERGAIDAPDRVYIALGTNGSAAGLALGLAAAGRPDVEVVGVRASSPATSSEAQVAAAVASTRRLLRERAPSFPDLEVRVAVDGGELGRGYALPTARAERALALAEGAGLRLETTYTAKAFAALMRDAARGDVRRAVFWMTHDGRPHTGAAPEVIPPELAGWLR